MVDPLTPAQRIQLSAHVARWTGILLRTGAADRPTFEAAARMCHDYAHIPWHGNVVWVSSPLVMALAGPMAALLLQWPEDALAGEAGDALYEAVRTGVDGALQRPVLDAVCDAVCGAPRRARLPMRAAAASSRDLLDEVARQALAGLVKEELARAQRLADDTVERARQRAVGRGLAGADIRVLSDEDRRHALVMAALAEEAQRVVHALGDAPADHPLQQMLPAVITRGWHVFVDGQEWMHRGAATSYLRDICHLEVDGYVWNRVFAREQMLQCASGWYPHRHFLIACEHPQQIHRVPVEVSPPARDSELVVHESKTPRAGVVVRVLPLTVHELHRTDGPAIAWADGWRIHCIHGRRVPAWLIEHPQALTVSRIEQETNAEVRRIMIECYGWRRYIADCGAEVVDTVPQDHPIRGLRGARLLRKRLPGEPEPLVYLDMVNSTPEPDGSHRHYLERIDPKLYDGDAGRLCHAAMASRWQHRDESGRLRRTFDRWQDYRPLAES